MKTITKFPVRSYFLIAVQVMTIFMLTACTKSNDMTGSGNQNPPPSTKGANEVFIVGMSFSPETLTVPVNTTVKWTNKDGIAHTVTSTTALFNSGSIGNGGTFTYTFTTAGTYSYYCAIHPTMVGEVVVQ
jgi:plastocyanin